MMVTRYVEQNQNSKTYKINFSIKRERKKTSERLNNNLCYDIIAIFHINVKIVIDYCWMKTKKNYVFPTKSSVHCCQHTHTLSNTHSTPIQNKHKVCRTFIIIIKTHLLFFSFWNLSFSWFPFNVLYFSSKMWNCLAFCSIFFLLSFSISISNHSIKYKCFSFVV